MLSYPTDCTILETCVFDLSMLADEIFTIALRSFETCLSVNNNLFRKLVSSLESPVTFDEWCKVTSVQFYFPDVNLLSR